MWSLFGGKGGVGKTTCAAAWALARADEGARVLIVSTDPAHSLADVFNKPLRQGRRSAMARRLDALELDAPSAVARWLKRRRPALSRLLERGTLLDREDIARVLTLPFPGLDELAAFLAMTEVDDRGDYDEIVVDTAPTGHTLRLLDTPKVIEGAADLLGAMHERHVLVAQALGGAAGADALVDELREDAARVEARLHDAAHTRLVWITLPEAVAIAETVDALDRLRRGGFPLTAIVVNRLTPAPVVRHGRRGCAECRARAAHERASLAPLARVARAMRPAIPLRTIAAQPTEPRGLPALRALAKQGQSPVKGGPSHVSQQKRATVPLLRATVPLLSAGVRLLFFGGKGGVGKTTCAAAVALSVAARFPDRPIRVISTDPAPSLGDVLTMHVGDAWTSVPRAGRLEARELDASKVFDDYRRRYQDAVDEFFDRIRGGSPIDATADRAVFERLFDLAPPGIDEVIALLTVVDVLQEDTDALLIVDTAPTGHTLRLLALHDDVQRWVALLMQLLIKYRLATRAESLVRDLVHVSRALREFRTLLADARRAQFVTVVRPAALPRLETARLMDGLRALRIAAPLVIVNGETTGTCAACRRRAAGERQELARLRRLCRGRSRGCDIIHAPLQLPPPRGPAELLAWAAGWRHDGQA